MPAPTSTDLQVPLIKTLDDSRFMQRLKADGLHANVQTFAVKAAALLGTINANMPLYTLHDERHILNVLAWMEWLAGDVIEQLAPAECALCVLAAYAHDLGMTLTPAEEAALCGKGDSPEQREYQRFLDGFVEEKHEIERLSRSTDATEKYAGRLLEQHLLTEFLRRTHSDTMAARMKGRIQQIVTDSDNTNLLRFGALDFQRWLELIALSHNQSTDWLRVTLNREGGFQRTVDGKPVNGVFVGLLLRLADIMDFDASRTPTILFHHLGLDRELGSRFEKLSQQEWKKHLAISGTPITKSADDWALTYEAGECDHPAVEKSIREFVGWIEREVGLCRDELSYMLRHCDHKHYMLRLPLVKHGISAQRINGVPVYVFEDWRFHLDQQKIIQLLMGESLYGDPSLCIRELLQNSLDALELRDLRLQLPKSERRDPTDGVPLKAKPGFFLDDDGNEQRLEVRLTWGREPNDGPWWIKVEDNGVGMTPAVIANYFTQLGNSFYTSADFESEKALLRRHGLLATPISQFGIGVLSCFMIADRVEVRTCPGGAVFNDHEHPRRPIDLTISGPGSLFWSKAGTRHHQGTEIRLTLRRTIKGKVVSLVHDQVTAIRSLRRHFGYPFEQFRVYPIEAGEFDPAHIAAQHLVWPKYPVLTGITSDAWVIDSDFHARLLVPINTKRLAAKLRDWGFTQPEIANSTWHHFDWTDSGATEPSESESATGSRIRLWFARPETTNERHPLDDFREWIKIAELASIVEPQIIESSHNRCRILIKGMWIRRLSFSMDQLASRVGARVWIDLRGAVTPKVTADRGVANVPEDAETWGAAVSKLWGRFRNHLCSELANSPTRIRNLLTLTIVSEQYSSILGKCNLPRAEVWGITGGIGELRFLAAQYHMILARDLMSELATAIQQAQSHSQQQESELITNPSRDVIDEYSAAKRRVQYLESLRDFALKLTPDMELSISLVLACLSASEFNISLVEFPKEDIKSTTLHLQDFPGWDSAYATAILNAAFGSDLAQSWVLLELFSLKGVIGNSTLVSPANCHFEFESDRQTVGFVDRDGAYPNQLTSLGYDLCYPISSIPLGRLRRDCARWRTDRRIQAVGTMPLLFPSYSDVWPIYRVPLRDLFGVPQIYALMPPPNLWLKPFADWSAEDWANPQHLSILWNIETGDVHYCGGIQTPAMTVRRGKTYKAAIRRIENKAK